MNQREQRVITSVIREFYDNTEDEGEKRLITDMVENMALGLWKTDVTFDPKPFLDAALGAEEAKRTFTHKHIRE